MEVTKSLFVNFSISKIYDLAKAFIIWSTFIFDSAVATPVKYKYDIQFIVCFDNAEKLNK